MSVTTTLPERYAQEAQSWFAEAESLLNLPIYIQHGDADQTVNVDNSRHAARLLQRWGYDVRYREHPGRGHEDLNNRDEIVEWFLAHRRVSSPLHVRVRATDLDGAAAYWVRVTALDSTIAVTRVDAEVIQPGEIRVDTQNVAAFTLSPPAASRNGAQPVRVVWNGTEHVAPVSANGTVSLDSAHATSLEKHPGLSGGLSSLITTPFAIVIGTASADPVMNRRCKEKAEGFAATWEAWQHQRPRIFTDEQLTPQDEQRYSLLLIGGADANLVSQYLLLYSMSGQPDDFVFETSESALASWQGIRRFLIIAGMMLPAIGLIVGAIVIMNIMLVAVAERTREIGIRKSIGAKRRDILAQFLVESATLSIVGAMLGVGLGVALSQAVAFVSPLPATVAPWSVALAVIIGAGVGIIAGAYPASRASRLDPIYAMRQE